VSATAQAHSSRPDRVQRLQQHLQEHGIDVALISGDSNVVHQSGYQRYYQGLAMVVVPAEGEPALLVPRDEVEAAKETAFTKSVVGYGERGFGLDLDPAAALVAALPEVVLNLLHDRAPACVGLAGAPRRAVNAFKALGSRPKSVALDGVLSTIREIKDREEIDAITYSYQLCLQAQEAVGRAARAGTTEIELFSLAHHVAQVANGAPVYFGADIQGGPHSAHVCSPIRVPGTRQLVGGDVLVADILVGARGYWGDSARTHGAGAMPNEMERQLADLEGIKVQAAERLRPGARGCDLFAWARQTIETTFEGGEFPHHLGHAVGVTNFEDPHLIPSDRRPLRAGMVIAVEPGVYFPGRYGLRTEDIYEVTPEGGRKLPTR
jgi:Xaa-Pro aminopeptidase